MTDTQITVTTRPPYSLRNRVGMVLVLILGALDVLSPVITPAGTDDQPGPPITILYLDTALGIVTIAAVVFSWVTRRRLGNRIAAGARLASVVTALPAFFVTGVATGLVAVVAVFVVVTVVSVYLLLAPSRR